MFDRTKEFFEGKASLGIDASGRPTDKDVQIAVGVLLLEAAGADEDYDPVETKTVFRLLEKEFGMENKEVYGLLEEADALRNVKEKIDDFVNAVNEHFNGAQKKKVLELVWRVMLADGKVEKFERKSAKQIQTRLQLTDEQALEAFKKAQAPQQ